MISGQINTFWLRSANLVAAFNTDRAQKNIHIETQPESNPGSTTWASHFISVNPSEVLIFFPENIEIIMPT